MSYLFKGSHPDLGTTKIIPNSPIDVPLTIQEDASGTTTANLLELKNAAGTVVFKSSPAGVITGGSAIIAQGSALVEAPIPLHASKVIYNLFVARDAWQVTHIDYTPDIAQGAALTATVVKAIGTATPASATTPMHTAAGIDLNAAAHTVQPKTLTSTTADLQLAAGDRIGLVLSGAMTVGSGLVSIRGKRI